jgi:glycosyltransferase involved in cell wall biosynthesis
MHSVGLIFRKPRKDFHSIEKVFTIVSSAKSETFKVNKHFVPCSTKGIISVIRNIINVRNCSDNIIHVTGDIHYAILGAKGKKSVLTIHDLVFLYRSKGLKKYFLKWLFLDLPVRYASVITTISETTKADILKHLKVNPEKIVVIPNPLDPSIQFSEHIFNEKCPRILFIGTGPNKNLERSIKALAGIKCHLRIIGRINDLQLDLLKSYQIDFSNAHNISESQIIIEYSKADIVLFPSTFEGFGLPILEGQQAGRVVITSNIDPMSSTAGSGAE